jgi:hypothetical protein
MGTTPSTRPISTATFTANTFTFDPLLAGECISQSALIGGAAALTRGTVLFGPAVGTPITGTTVLTPVFSTGEVARCILAADIDVTAGNLTGLVYTQGKFLDTAMIFTSQGAALDVAQLWDTGIYVLTVEQRSGLLVPMTGLPATGGPLPQVVEEKKNSEHSTSQEEKSTEHGASHSVAKPPVPNPTKR